MKTLKEAFEKLIQEKQWYAGTGLKRQQAYNDKERFNNGKLSAERVRMYLASAGWECKQNEKWGEK